MYLGPIHPTLPGLSTGHNPVKPIKVVSSTGRQTVLFDQEYSYATQSSPIEIDAETVLYEATPAAAVARLTQIAELTRNTEWQRCGLFVQWREDGVNDAEDGWYNLKGADLSEEFLFSSYAEPQLQLEQRAIQRLSVGVFVDAKAVPNDANGSGVTLAAVPMGFASPYPVVTYNLPGANGNIAVVENAPSVIRATLANAQTVMTQGRCRLNDQNTGRTTVTEVFWKDHRNLNGKWEISNDLLRYYFAEGDNAPAIDVWDVTAAGWVTMGNYQLQVSNTGPVLPLQSVQFQTISPEEVIWTERRFDTAGTALVVVTNRVRRGSRLIESSIVAASGAGLTGTQSIGIVSAPNVAWTVNPSSDVQGIAFSDGFEVPVASVNYFQGLGTSAFEGAAVLTDWVQLRGAWTKAANVVTAPITAGKNQVVVGSTGPIVGGLDAQSYVYQQRVSAAQVGAGICAYVGSLDNSYVLKFSAVNTVALFKNVAGTLTQVGSNLSFTFTAGNANWLKIDLSTAGTIVFSAAVDSAGAPGVYSSSTTTDATYAAGGFGLYNDGTGTAPTFGGAFVNVCQVTGNGYGWTPFQDGTVNYDAFLYVSPSAPFAGSFSGAVFVPAGGNVSSSNRWGWQHTTTVANVTYYITGSIKAPSAASNYSFAVGAASSGNLSGTAAFVTTSFAGTPAANAAFMAPLCNAAGTFYADNLFVSVGGTGVAFTSSSKLVPGFCYLTQNPSAPSAPANTTLYSGATVPAGTITRLAILCGDQDAQYTALATAAAYAGRWASYNRQRVRQRILVGLVA